MRFPAIFLCSVLIVPSFCSDRTFAEPDRFAGGLRSILVEMCGQFFKQRCICCHGSEQQEGQLRLDARAAFQAGWSLWTTGSVVGRGSPQFVATKDHNIRGGISGCPSMKIPSNLQRFKSIGQWLSQGAVWPEGIGSQVEVAEPHWSYIAPTLPELPPVVHRSWPHNPIDRFVLARLEKAGHFAGRCRISGHTLATGLSRSDRLATNGGRGRGIFSGTDQRSI